MPTQALGALVFGASYAVHGVADALQSSLRGQNRQADLGVF